MKKTVLKFSKVAIATIMMVATTTLLNAQPNPSNDLGAGGLLDGSANGVGDVAQVPFDANMTLLFIATAILFVTYKYKKGQLSILG